MDAKERHELKSNELADWLSDMPDFLRQHSGKILGIALIVAGLISWPILSRMRRSAELSDQIQTTSLLDTLDRGKYRALQSSQQDTTEISAFLVTANSLQDQAKELKNPDLAALALIKRGQALRADLYYQKRILPAEMVRSQIAQAQQAYQQAADKAKSAPIMAIAQFGLGLCAEELGQVEQASTIYSRIVESEEFAGTPVQVQARRRIQEMKDNTAEYVFVEPPAEVIPLPQPGQEPSVFGGGEGPVLTMPQQFGPVAEPAIPETVQTSPLVEPQAPGVSEETTPQATEPAKTE